jgi:hypothetical protein
MSRPEQPVPAPRRVISPLHDHGSPAWRPTASVSDFANAVADALRNVFPDMHSTAFYTEPATVVHTG